MPVTARAVRSLRRCCPKSSCSQEGELCFISTPGRQRIDDAQVYGENSIRVKQLCLAEKRPDIVRY